MDELPSVPESRLPDHLLARLPASTPGPPWDCQVRAVVWVQRGRCPLPAGAPPARGLTLGAVVDYLDSPVGPYREVFAGPLLRGHLLPVVHVPFIAVDSLPSVHGGRAHWSLPKATAAFTGDVGAGGVRGEGWSLEMQATARGPQLPLRGLLRNRQTAQIARISLRGRGRLATVRVRATGPTLSGWLGAGTHLGVVGEGRMVVRAPA